MKVFSKWWNSPPVKEEPSTPKFQRPISAHYREESKRLDSEIERKAKGKEADLEVKGYIKRVKDISDS